MVFNGLCDLESAKSPPAGFPGLHFKSRSFETPICGLQLPLWVLSNYKLYTELSDFFHKALWGNVAIEWMLCYGTFKLYFTIWICLTRLHWNRKQIWILSIQLAPKAKKSLPSWKSFLLSEMQSAYRCIWQITLTLTFRTFPYDSCVTSLHILAWKPLCLKFQRELSQTWMWIYVKWGQAASRPTFSQTLTASSASDDISAPLTNITCLQCSNTRKSQF